MNQNAKKFPVFLFFLSLTVFYKCNVGISINDPGLSNSQYTVGGVVQGLSTGESVVLQNNGSDNVTITGTGSGNDSFVFFTKMSHGESFSITILSQPLSSSCSVGGNVGTVNTVNINTILVTCGTVKYSIGGNIAGLTGSSLVLNLNGAENLAVNGAVYSFSTTLASNSNYAISIAQQPSLPTQVCTFDSTNNNGIIASTNITNINLTCTTASFTIAGTVTGLNAGDTIVIQNNGAGNQSATGSSPSFIFPSQTDGTTYNVTILSVSGGANCSVNNATGTLSGMAVTNVGVVCSYPGSYTVSGALSGINGGTVVLKNGIDYLFLTSNGVFTFSTSYVSGTAYNATVFQNPTYPSQVCTLANGSGTISGAVTNITVSCVTNTFTVGGTVSGIPGGGSVTITNNGANAINLTSASTSFTFPAQSDGTIYNVAISAQTAGTSCTLGSNVGNLSGSNITNISLICSGLAGRTIGGTISGLSLGAMPPRTGIMLQNNGGDNLTIATNGNFVFTTAMYDLQTYSVTILNQPTNPGEVCTILNAAGTVSGNITSISITCTLNSYTVSGNVTGLAASEQVVLQNNGAGNIAVIGGGSGTDAFTFAPQNDLTSYNITIFSAPAGKTCTPGTNTGTINGVLVNNVSVSCSVIPTYSIGGTVTGLAATGTIVIKNNGTDTLILNGTPSSPSTPFSFTFGATLQTGAGYSVAVTQQPSQPASVNQQCTVSGGSGTMASANITSISVSCLTVQYSIAGQITGLAGPVPGPADSITLQLNGANNITINGGGTGIDNFTFNTVPAKITDGQAYAVTFLTAPTGKTCTTGASSGTISGSSISNVTINCSTIPKYSVGGAVSGLATGNNVVLQNNFGDNLTVNANGAFTFATTLLNAAAYSVTVLTQPTTPNQTCSVTGGAGSISSANVAGVVVNCATTQYTVGGAVSGMNGGDSISLLNNNANPITLGANGSFTFPLQDDGSTYNVIIASMPATSTCSVGGNPGTLAGANVTNITITCSSLPTYTIGGVVNGLVGTGLVLQNNGGNNLSRTGDGAFSFTIPKNTGNSYAVTVATQPSSPSQFCSVDYGAGTVAAANVTSISVNCVLITYTVGVTVTGLGSGDMVYLQNNGNDGVWITGGGTGTDTGLFNRSINTGYSYNILNYTYWNSPNVANGEAGIQCNTAAGNNYPGGVMTLNVSVTIACTYSYSITATITGLPSGTGVFVYENNYSGVWNWINGTGIDQTLTFPAPYIPVGGTYNVQASNAGFPYQCTVSGGTGIMPAANITSGITVICIDGTINLALGTPYADSTLAWTQKPYKITGLNAGTTYTFTFSGLNAASYSSFDVYSDYPYTTFKCSNGGYLTTMSCQASGSTAYYFYFYPYANQGSYTVTVSQAATIINVTLSSTTTISGGLETITLYLNKDVTSADVWLKCNGFWGGASTTMTWSSTGVYTVNLYPTTTGTCQPGEFDINDGGNWQYIWESSFVGQYGTTGVLVPSFTVTPIATLTGVTLSPNTMVSGGLETITLNLNKDVTSAAVWVNCSGTSTSNAMTWVSAGVYRVNIYPTIVGSCKPEKFDLNDNGTLSSFWESVSVGFYGSTGFAVPTFNVVATLVANYTFEGLVSMPAAFTASGAAAWVIDNTTGYGSAYSMASGTITNSQDTCAAITVNNPSAGGVSFNYKNDGESGYDGLFFFINGVSQTGAYVYPIQWGGSIPWTLSPVYPLSAGLNTLQWCYHKDSTVSAGADKAWVDNIVVY